MDIKTVKAAMLGVIVGDALGVPVEFMSRADLTADPVTGMREYGTHDQPAGTWSDDSSMALCLMESLTRGVDYEDMGRISFAGLTRGTGLLMAKFLTWVLQRGKLWSNTHIGRLLWSAVPPGSETTVMAPLCELCRWLFICTKRWEPVGMTRRMPMRSYIMHLGLLTPTQSA